MDRVRQWVATQGRLRSRRTVLKGVLSGVTATSLPETVTATGKNDLEPTLGERLPLNFSLPDNPTVGTSSTIGVTVSVPDLSLIGDPEERLTVRLLIDDTQVAERQQPVQQGDESEFSFEHTFETTGTKTITTETTVEFPIGTLKNSISQPIDIVAPSISVSGAAFPLPEALEDDIDQYRSDHDLLPEFVFVLANGEQQSLVFTDTDPIISSVAADGRRLGDSISFGELDLGVLVAKTATFDTAATQTTVDDITNNPAQFAFDVIEVSTSHTRTGLRTRFADDGISYPTTTGVAGIDTEPSTLFGQTGERLRTIADDPSNGSLESFISTHDESPLVTLSPENGFWYGTTPTLTGVVIPAGVAAREFLSRVDQEAVSIPQPDAPILYVSDVDHDPTEVADVPSLIQQSSELAGEIVRLDAAVFQTTISVQETMEATTACGDNRVQIKEACVDVVNDAVLHGGVAWSGPPQDRGDMIPLLGVSTWDQLDPLQDHTGEYEIIGEVVSTARIDDALPDSEVLVVYAIERTGELDYETLDTTVKTRIEDTLEPFVSASERQASVSGDNFNPDLDLTPVVGENLPQDLTGDGLYRDIRGDGDFDIFDIQTLYANLDTPAIQNQSELFNFAGNDPSEVDIFDVQALYSDLSSGSDASHE